MSIAERFQRSWDITKQTFQIMNHDREILLLPILSALCSLILFTIFIVPFVVGMIIGNTFGQEPLFLYGGIFIFYFATMFIATFFNAAVVHIAKTRMSGGDATLKDGLRTSLQHLKQLLGWAVLAATVGLILNILDSQAREKGGIIGIIGRIVVSLIGLAWAIVSVFVVPAIVLKGVGPITALKHSALAVKKTWGESLIRYYGLGMVQGIFTIIGILFFLIPTVLLFLSSNLILAGIFLGIFVLYIALVAIIFSSANTIFNTALFIYADSGKVPSLYSKENVEHAFVKR